jgi:RHS repeat-associated protein
VTARLASVQLRTGGTVSYAYSGGNNGIFSDGTTATLTRTTPDGTWTYARAPGTLQASTTTISAPQLSYDVAANQTVIQFQGIYETQRQVYQGSSTSGTLLATTYTCYNGTAAPCSSTAVALPFTQRDVTVQLPNNLQSKTTTLFNSYGLPTETDEYDYGSGGPPASPLRKTLVTYASLGNGIVDHPATVTVCSASGSSASCNGTGTQVAQTSIAYDQTTPTATSGVPQHVAISGSRGNPTTVTRWINSTTSAVSTMSYYDTGKINVATDPGGHHTTFSYSDSWGDSACAPPANTQAYPTTITNHLSQNAQIKYYQCSGQAYSVRDPNDIASNRDGVKYIYSDPLGRLTEADFADGGQTTWTFNSATSITTTTKMNSSQNAVSTLLLDGLGRNRQTQLNSDPQGVDYTDTAYDAVGRVASVSNPYRSTSDPTYGITSYRYDALSRISKVIPPDGSSSASNISATYSGNTTTVTDQAGKKRQSTTDALGHLTQIIEDPGGLGYITTYSYDGLSNLTNVVQNGSRQRSFIYDALSRLVCQSNPEIQIATCPNPDNGSYTAGTIRYAYDNTGNLTSRIAPAPNQTGSATVTTTYSYDALNRLTSRTYNDGVTLAASFGYDETSIWGATLLNPIGRLTHTAVASTANSAMSYDAVGRPLNQWQWTPTNWNTNVSGSFPVAYTYDLAGDTASASNGMGVTISYSYNQAARLNQVTSSLVDSQHPGTLATVDSSIGYYPNGAVRKITYGNGITETAAYNTPLQRCRYNVNSSAAALGTCADAIPSGNIQDFNYGFSSGTANNGSVASWTATGQQAFNRTYTYDSLNRIGAMADSNTGQACRGLSWTYDAWGNRTDQTVTSGTCNTFHQTVNTQNRLVGTTYQYDAAGNMTNDGSHSYTYDAENRLTKVDSGSTATYVYDANGHRVRSTVGGTSRDYVYNSDSVVAEWYSSCNCWGFGYVYASAAFLAQYANSTTYFAHKDHLGSTRLLTKMDKSVYDSFDFLPFGEQIAGGSGTSHKFTSDERDGESNLDHTWFRQYSSSLGRWISVDPLPGSAEYPQSLNRYSYVLNDPQTYFDPFGLHPVCAGGVVWDAVDYLVNGEYQGTDYYFTGDPCDDRGGRGGAQSLGGGGGGGAGGGGGGGGSNGGKAGNAPRDPRCPGKLASVITSGLITSAPPFMAAQLAAKTSGHTITVGYDANATLAFGTFGGSAHAGDAFAFDPNGNIAWISTTGGGGGFGGDVGLTGQVGYLRETSVLELAARSSTITSTIAYGQGIQGSGSTDLEGNITLSVGAGEGVATSATYDVSRVTIIACTP